MSRSRRAISLIELLVVMTASTVVITLASGLLCRIMRIQVESRAQVDVERNSLRLVNQFRRDVHQATTATVDRTSLPDGVFLRLEFAGDERVEYSQLEGTLLRQATRKDRPTAREEFALPTGSEASIREVGLPRRLVLTVRAQPISITSVNDKSFLRVQPAPVGLQAESEVGRDQRFVATAPLQESSE